MKNIHNDRYSITSVWLEGWVVCLFGHVRAYLHVIFLSAPAFPAKDSIIVTFHANIPVCAHITVHFILCFAKVVYIF